MLIGAPPSNHPEYVAFRSDAHRRIDDFAAFHHDERGNAHYAELAGNNQDSENIALATSVHSRAIRNTGAIDRGIQRARFSVLCTINRPAILFEGGFVSNAQEGRRIASEEYQDKLAKSICDGVVSYSAVIGRQQIRPTNKSSIGAARRGSGIRATSKSSTRLRSRGNYSGSSRM